MDQDPVVASTLPPSSFDVGKSLQEELSQALPAEALHGAVVEAPLAADPDSRLEGHTIAILATDGFEQSELAEPRKALEQAGARVCIVSPVSDSIKGWTNRNWGDEVHVDVPLVDADAQAFDALVLPGGTLSADKLRNNKHAVAFVKAFFEQGKPVAAICHAPWLLVEAGVVDGVKLTSWPSLQTDIRNAGGDWHDQEVVRDGMLVTSRKPGDLPAFNREMLELFANGRGDPPVKVKLKVGAPDVS